jgi:hypothetical protein
MVCPVSWSFKFNFRVKFSLFDFIQTQLSAKKFSFVLIRQGKVNIGAVPGTLIICFVISLTIHSSSGCSPAGYFFFLSWVSDSLHLGK